MGYGPKRDKMFIFSSALLILFLLSLCQFQNFSFKLEVHVFKALGSLFHCVVTLTVMLTVQNLSDGKVQCSRVETLS